MSEQFTHDTTVLFIGNVPYSIIDTEFHALVSQHGDVVIAAIVRDERDRSRGFGFARFASHEAAAAAKAALDGLAMDGRNLRVSFARDDSRYIELVNV